MPLTENFYEKENKKEILFFNGLVFTERNLFKIMRNTDELQVKFNFE